MFFVNWEWELDFITCHFYTPGINSVAFLLWPLLRVTDSFICIIV